MSLFDPDFTQNITAATGRPTGFFDGLSAGYNQQYRVDSPYSLEAEIEDAWKSTLDRYEKLTGERPQFNRSLASLSNYARTIEGKELSFWQQELGGGIPEQTQRDIAAFQKFNDTLKASGDPEYKSFEQVLDEVFKMQAEIEGQSRLSAETGGFGEALGQFIGATAGAFSTRDPLTLATLGVGGVGKSVFARVSSAGVFSGGITAVTELGAVQGNRELAGLEARDPIFDIAVAAAAGGAFQGLGDLVSNFLRGRRARAVGDASRLPELPADSPDPRIRAVKHIFDMEDAVTLKSPYGASRQGLRRFVAELEEVQNIFAGRTDTAVAQVLPPVPFEQLQKAADFDIVKEVAPEIFGRLEAAQLRLQEVRARADELEAAVPQLPDALDAIDPDTGALVRSLVDDLDQPGLTTQRRQDIERRLQIITESVGEERIAQVLNDISIGPKKEMQSARGSLRAANREYKKAYAEVEAVRTQLVRRQEAQERIQQRLFANDLTQTVVQGNAPLLLGRVSGDAATAIADKLKTLDVEIDVEGQALVTAFDETADVIDIGGTTVPADMLLVDEAGNSITARAMMLELREDARLDEAMRTCLL